MLCGQCGKQNSSEYQFCPKCGEPINSGKVTKSPSGKISARVSQNKFEEERDKEDIRFSFWVILVGGLIWFSGIGGYIELLSIWAAGVSIFHIIFVKMLKLF
jgi:uncharacterized membrane protein YvbJ